MLLPSMYHWSPAERYESITLSGLVAGSPPVTASTALHRVSVSPDPQAGAHRPSAALSRTAMHSLLPYFAFAFGRPQRGGGVVTAVPRALPRRCWRTPRQRPS